MTKKLFLAESLNKQAGLPVLIQSTGTTKNSGEAFL